MHRLYLGRMQPQRIVNEVEALTHKYSRDFMGDVSGTATLRFRDADPETTSQDELNRMLEAGMTILDKPTRHLHRAQ
jgi:hypothetical protein